CVLNKLEVRLVNQCRRGEGFTSPQRQTSVRNRTKVLICARYDQVDRFRNSGCRICHPLVDRPGETIMSPPVYPRDRPNLRPGPEDEQTASPIAPEGTNVKVSEQLRDRLAAHGGRARLQGR